MTKYDSAPLAFGDTFHLIGWSDYVEIKGEQSTPKELLTTSQ